MLYKIGENYKNDFRRESLKKKQSAGQFPHAILDVPPPQKMKIAQIWINIYCESACFENSAGVKFIYRPLCEYVPILRQSEADVLGCKTHIIFNSYHILDSPKSIPKNLEEFSQEIHSIAHLWANGRVVADLSEYPEDEDEVLPVSDFCDGLFSQERSILKCKVLEISLANSWPFSVVTNAAGYCNQLILTQAPRDQQNALLDALSKGKLPQHIEVTLNLHSSKCMNEFIDELKKRFQRSTEQNFKLTLLFPRNSASPNMELQNEHGLTLTTTTQASHNEHCDSVMIEQHSTS
ncbi:hypothetical protein Ddc_24369 [Ditylenchus destructor]|nr:hypothetical protein Ddc_24369 [Ditylenchus destructor]